jgi:hypothetical protein
MRNDEEWHGWDKCTFKRDFDRDHLFSNVGDLVQEHLQDTKISGYGCEQLCFPWDSHTAKLLWEGTKYTLASDIVKHFEIQIMREGEKWLENFVSKGRSEAVEALMSGQSVLELITQSQTRQDERLKKLSEADI